MISMPSTHLMRHIIQRSHTLDKSHSRLGLLCFPVISYYVQRIIPTTATTQATTHTIGCYHIIVSLTYFGQSVPLYRRRGKLLLQFSDAALVGLKLVR